MIGFSSGLSRQFIVLTLSLVLGTACKAGCYLSAYWFGEFEDSTFAIDDTPYSNESPLIVMPWGSVMHVSVSPGSNCGGVTINWTKDGMVFGHESSVSLTEPGTYGLHVVTSYYNYYKSWTLNFTGQTTTGVSPVDMDADTFFAYDPGADAIVGQIAAHGNTHGKLTAYAMDGRLFWGQNIGATPEARSFSILRGHLPQGIVVLRLVLAEEVKSWKIAIP